jgi:trimethyllysine dioxygenase
MVLQDKTFQFHSMWLRDSCPDDNNIALKAGERKLIATPDVGPLSHVDPSHLEATAVKWQDGETILKVSWNDASPNLPYSTFSREFLERYAPVVAKHVGGSSETPGDETWNTTELDIPSSLEPYSDYPDAPAPTEYEEWGKEDRFRHFHHEQVMKDPRVLLDLLETTLLVGKGVTLVDNVPETDNASELITFIQHSLGGLQKDPTRDEPNWKIVHQPSAAANISYDRPAKRLYQHTDSSVPPHGIPGLALAMHYVEGYGANTLTDGYSVANYMKETDPNGYELLSTYGYDGERDFAASGVDSSQDIAKGLLIPRRHPIFINDESNHIVRLQYDEVFRMPFRFLLTFFRTGLPPFPSLSNSFMTEK